MPHSVPSTTSNSKTVSAPTQKSGDTSGPNGASRTVTSAGTTKPSPGFNGGKGF